MTFLIPKKQHSLFFKSAGALADFKHETNCKDFYIDKDALAMVGFFTDEQIGLAKTKYEAKCNTVQE